jgi:hypothetical protein
MESIIALLLIFFKTVVNPSRASHPSRASAVEWRLYQKIANQITAAINYQENQATREGLFWLES